MKKQLLILLCLPMIFISCNDIKQIKNQINKFSKNEINNNDALEDNLNDITVEITKDQVMSELNDLIQILKTESGYEMILNKKIDNLNSGYMYISENDNKEAYALSDKDLLDLEVGSVIGPFSPREGVLRIIKINGIEYRSDSLEARHIMIQPKNDINLDSAFMIIESIEEKINNNYDFSDLAQKFSDDRSSSIRGGDLGWFQEGIMVSEFNNACFEAEVGELSVVLTQFGVHLVEVTASSPEVPKLKIIYLEKYFDE